MKLLPSSVLKIAFSSILLAVPFYVILTIVNLIRFAPEGIFAKKMGSGELYQSNVGDLFREVQDTALPVAVLASCILVAAAHISDSSSEK